MATLGEDGTIDAATQLTAFDSSDLGTEPALVLEGDTLQSIAQRVYGNGNLWYVLAAANAVTDADLVAGTTLKAPAVKTTANDANTFKPYDPSKIEGPTTPSLPYISAPSQHGCNMLATVIRLFVAVIVTYVTMNPAVGAAVAGFGEAAAQTVEIQDGDRQGYDWGQVGVSALTAYFAGSQTGQKFAGWAAEYGRAGQFVRGATMAAASDVASYALHKALGEDASFNLRGVVSDSVAAGIGASALGPAPTVNGVPANAPSAGAFDWTQIARAAVTSVLRQGISYGVHQAIEGHAAWNNGQVLGNAVTDAAVTAASMSVEEQRQREIARRRSNPLGLTEVQLDPAKIEIAPVELLPLNLPNFGQMYQEMAASDVDGLSGVARVYYDQAVSQGSDHEQALAYAQGADADLLAQVTDTSNLMASNDQALPYDFRNGFNNPPGADNFLPNFVQDRRAWRFDVDGLIGPDPTGVIRSVADQLNAKFGTKIDAEALKRFEGGQILKANVPAPKTSRSGVTIATGVDLGQMSPGVLSQLGLPDALYEKLAPYTSADPKHPLIKQLAVDYLKENPLVITQPEADILDFAVQGMHLSAAINSWNDASELVGGVAFQDLTEQQQTVILSRTYHQGPGMAKTSIAQSFYQAAIGGDWASAGKLLYNYPVKQGWYIQRVHAEARYLGYRGN